MEAEARVDAVRAARRLSRRHGEALRAASDIEYHEDWSTSPVSTATASWYSTGKRWACQAKPVGPTSRRRTEMNNYRSPSRQRRRSRRRVSPQERRPGASGEIAEAIGIESKGIAASLAAAVENGVLVACDVTSARCAAAEGIPPLGGGTPIAWLSASNHGACRRSPPPPRESRAEEPARKAPKPRKAPKARPSPSARRERTRSLVAAPRCCEGRRKNAKPAQIIPENIPGNESMT
ncbi:MAG: hypothetical protein M5R42_16820 [Rhodocyclaceae bacterium]|nr:hypothetical protein [Rhodocyclaceae bacterium]